MFTERKISFREARTLLETCGLIPVDAADYTVGIYNQCEELVATGALVGDMLQMIAVAPCCQGEDLSARVVSHLIRYAAEQGILCLYMFSKYESADFFESLGFRRVAAVKDAAALLEWGSPGIREYCEELKKLRSPEARKVGSLVMNCNPFTRGHRYLVEQAAGECEQVFLLVVEEDLSEFPFSVRMELIRRGVADLRNVKVIPGGRYVISSLTFPAYFSRDAVRSRMQSRMDAEIFARHIAPALSVTDRYLGEEPYSPSTDVYNEAVLSRLPSAGVAVHVIPRAEVDGRAVSASEVRRKLKAGDLKAVEKLVPLTTFQFIQQHGEQVCQWVNR
jgi:[citrate (pro-3S)-lyase] ligase